MFFFLIDSYQTFLSVCSKYSLHPYLRILYYSQGFSFSLRFKQSIHFRKFYEIKHINHYQRLYVFAFRKGHCKPNTTYKIFYFTKSARKCACGTRRGRSEIGSRSRGCSDSQWMSSECNTSQ